MNDLAPVAWTFCEWSRALDKLQADHEEHKARLAANRERLQRTLTWLSGDNPDAWDGVEEPRILVSKETNGG